MLMPSDARPFTSLQGQDDLTLDDLRRLAPPPRVIPRDVQWPVQYWRMSAGVHWLLFTLCLLAMVFVYGVGNWKTGLGYFAAKPIVTTVLERGLSKDVTIPDAAAVSYTVCGLTFPRPVWSIAIVVTLFTLWFGGLALSRTARNSRLLRLLQWGLPADGRIIDQQPLGEQTVYGRAIPTYLYTYQFTDADGNDRRYIIAGMEGEYPEQAPLIYHAKNPADARVLTQLTGVWPRAEFLIDDAGQVRAKPGASRWLLLVPIAGYLALIWAVVTILANLLFLVTGA